MARILKCFRKTFREKIPVYQWIEVSLGYVNFPDGSDWTNDLVCNWLTL